MPGGNGPAFGDAMRIKDCMYIVFGYLSICLLSGAVLGVVAQLLVQ